MSSPETEKPQEHATRLLEVADVVLESHDNHRKMLGMIMDDQIFASQSTVESGATGGPDTEETRQSSDDTKDSDDRAKKEKRPRHQTVSELKQQLQDCHNALLTMRENANLKYRKLELEFVDLKATLSTTRAELDVAKAECQNLDKEKQILSDKLAKAVGEEKAEWFENLQASYQNLEKELSLTRLEREEKTRANEELRKIMRSCSRCRRFLPQSQQVLSRNTSVKSLWGWESLAGAIVGLDQEAQATTSPQLQKSLMDPTQPQPPPEMFTFMEQSQRIKEDLEADIEAMERQMKDDIESLKNEWSRAPKIYNRERSGKKNDKPKKDRKSKKKSKGMSSLDSFFSSATAGLEEEEMDEEKSFFSLSRSVNTAPGHLEKRKKKKQKHRKKSNQPAINEENDRRGNFRAEGKGKSLRNNLQEKIKNLGQEQVPEHSSFFRSSRSISGKDARGSDSLEHGSDSVDHFDEMARQVEAWGVEASRSTTVL